VNHEFSVIHGRIRFNINFSRILAKKGSKLIGRKEVIESGGLLGLGTRMMVENFHCMGKYDSLIMELIISERWIKAFLGEHLATSAVMRSKPGDFLWEYLLTANFISLGVKCLIGLDGKSGGELR